MPSGDAISANEVVASYIGHDLNIDDFENEAWRNADPVQIDRYWSGEPVPPGRKANVALLWSDWAVYVQFFANQFEPLIVSKKPQLNQKTKGLWDRDVCEIFIAPDPNAVERYFELEAAPTGEWLDVAIRWSARERESDWGFNSGMTTATKLGRSFLFTTMRIPWSREIPQPQKGDRWRINLFRCVGKDPDRGYVAWQPTMTPQPSFHVPQVFGWLIFG
jgi:Carbohydrate family 9 binding domain-like